MKTIDLANFERKDFEFKTKNGDLYCIDFVSAISENSLLKEQANFSSKSGNFASISSGDQSKWKDIITIVLKEQKNDGQRKYEDEKIKNDIDEMSLLEIITIMMALISYTTAKSDIIYQAFDNEQKEELKKAKEDLKKKTMSKALSESDQ